MRSADHARESARYELPARIGCHDRGRCSRVEPRVWYNPELRSTLFLVPGLIAYIAMITAVVSTALSIVREKERGTMEQVRMAPIGAGAVRARQDGAVLRRLAGLGDGHRRRRDGCCSACRCAARGCVLLLGIVSLFLVGALGLGLLISSVADTQQVAFQLALLASFLPTLMLSGLHLSDCEHADVPAGRHLRRARRATSWSRCEASCSRAPGCRIFWPHARARWRVYRRRRARLWPRCGCGGSGA